MIREEEYEVVGYIQKVCVCDNCMIEMQKSDYMYMSNPPQFMMKCPKCGKEENIICDALSGGLKLVKKVED